MGPEYRKELRGLYVAAEPLGPQRTLLQGVNHVFVKGERVPGVRGLEGPGHTQIPIEFLLPLSGPNLGFRVWVAGEDPGLLDRLGEALVEPVYPLSLGPAFALAWVEEVALGDGELQPGWSGEGRGWWLARSLQLDFSLLWRKEPFKGLKPYRDLYPVLLDEERGALRVEELVVELSGRTLPVKSYGEAVLVAEGQGIGVVQLVP